MKIISVLTLATVLTGCASSATGLMNRAPIETYTSAQSAEHVAACIALSLNGPSPYVKDGPDHYVVTRQNGFGRAVVRIDITGAGAGSKVEVRRSIPVNTGLAKVKACVAGA